MRESAACRPLLRRAAMVPERHRPRRQCTALPVTGRRQNEQTLRLRRLRRLIAMLPGIGPTTCTRAATLTFPARALQHPTFPTAPDRSSLSTSLMICLANLPT